MYAVAQMLCLVCFSSLKKCVYLLAFRMCTGECVIWSWFLGQHPLPWIFHCCTGKEEHLYVMSSALIVMAVNLLLTFSPV